VLRRYRLGGERAACLDDIGARPLAQNTWFGAAPGATMAIRFADQNGGYTRLPSNG
jgi:hypothetical protein